MVQSTVKTKSVLKNFLIKFLDMSCKCLTFLVCHLLKTLLVNNTEVLEEKKNLFQHLHLLSKNSLKYVFRNLFVFILGCKKKVLHFLSHGSHNGPNWKLGKAVTSISPSSVPESWWARSEQPTWGARCSTLPGQGLGQVKIVC